MNALDRVSSESRNVTGRPGYTPHGDMLRRGTPMRIEHGVDAVRESKDAAGNILGARDCAVTFSLCKGRLAVAAMSRDLEKIRVEYEMELLDHECPI